MKIRFVLGLASLAVVVASACHSPRRFDGTESWHDIMEDLIGPRFDDMLDALDTGPNAAGFARIAEDAELSADYLALGYGVHERKDVEGFAALAREAEAWMREIAERARARDATRVEQLILDGQALHCDRCHDKAG